MLKAVLGSMSHHRNISYFKYTSERKGLLDWPIRMSENTKTGKYKICWEMINGLVNLH